MFQGTISMYEKLLDTVEQKWQKKKNLVKKQAIENKKSPKTKLHPLRYIEIYIVFKMYI